MKIKNRYSTSNSGLITYVNVNKGFVIIEDSSTKYTYFGHIKNFVFTRRELSISLKGKPVGFNIIYNSGRNKKEATNIIFIQKGSY